MKTVEAETEITEKIAETATTEVTEEKNEILNEQETEQIKIDDDFNDSDLDFLDEKSVEKLTIDDIKGQKEAKSEEPGGQGNEVYLISRRQGSGQEGRYCRGK